MNTCKLEIYLRQKQSIGQIVRVSLAWPGHSSAKGATMILDDTSEVKNDPDREARKILT
jgi:hypothetical protein